MRRTPCAWRRAWALYRSVQTTDSRGDPVRKYDMTSPDYTGEAGKASGVCWQITSDGIQVDTSGERPTRTAAFVLYDSAVEIAPFDRCIFDGGTWEVKAVQSWPNHRYVTLEAV